MYQARSAYGDHHSANTTWPITITQRNSKMPSSIKPVLKSALKINGNRINSAVLGEASVKTTNSLYFTKEAQQAAHFARRLGNPITKTQLITQAWRDMK